MVNDSDSHYLMLSGIQHFEFCPRQWALIHVEQKWEENVKTIEGQHLHRKADQPFLKEKRGDKITTRGMPIHSTKLKINGVCDVVEFIKNDSGVELNNLDGSYLAYPVEYKRGKPKKNDADILQLVAQAMCLEEMLLCEINKGFLYYHEIKRRVEIEITNELKNKVTNIVDKMHHYYKNRYTPKVKTGPFCRNCSLQHICLPKLMNIRSVKQYIEGKIGE